MDISNQNIMVARIIKKDFDYRLSFWDFHCMSLKHDDAPAKMEDVVEECIVNVNVNAKEHDYHWKEKMLSKYKSKVSPESSTIYYLEIYHEKTPTLIYHQFQLPNYRKEEIVRAYSRLALYHQRYDDVVGFPLELDPDIALLPYKNKIGTDPISVWNHIRNNTVWPQHFFELEKTVTVDLLYCFAQYVEIIRCRSSACANLIMCFINKDIKPTKEMKDDLQSIINKALLAFYSEAFIARFFKSEWKKIIKTVMELYVGWLRHDPQGTDPYYDPDTPMMTSLTDFVTNWLSNDNSQTQLI